MDLEKSDISNIKSIHKKYGTIKINSYPTMNFLTGISCEIFKFWTKTSRTTKHGQL